MSILKKIFDFFFTNSVTTPSTPEVTTPKFGLGALPSPVDVRNISLASFQEPVAIPDEYETILPPVENQGNKGKCVGSAIHKVAELYLTPKDGSPVKEWLNLSDDDLYEQCKLIDGIPGIEGTYPTVGAKVAVNSGIATVEAYNTGDSAIISESRKKNKLQGYAFIPADFGSICQGIFQNGAVTASLALDTNWYIGRIVKVLKSIGRHYVVLKGFKLSSQTIKGQNSWGVGWIGFIAGVFHSDVKAGAFEFAWADYSDNISDIIVFPYTIPPKILEEAKSTEYRFTKDLKIGDQSFEVTKLQERLKKEGYNISVIDGKFGKGTQSIVILYQKANGLLADGIVGVGTRARLNSKSVSAISAWAKAIQNHEGYLSPTSYPPKGSRSYRNNSPANFKTTGGLTDYMKKLGGIGVDPQGFVIFPTYQHGFDALCKFLTDACNNKLNAYNSSMTLLEFFKKYAPSADSNDPLKYAQTVAKALGCTIDTKISELL